MSIGLLKFFDKYILGLKAIVLGLFTIKTTKPSKVDNILIIKIWAIGDSVNTLPIIKNINDKYPKSKITVLTKKSLRPVYNQEFIDKTIFFDTFEGFFKIIFSIRKYDIVLDFEPFVNISAIISWWTGKYRIGFDNQQRSKIYHYKSVFHKDKHIIETYADMCLPLGLKNKKISLIELKYNPDDKTKIEEFLKNNNIHGKNSRDKKTNKIIGICASVGQSVPERSWPKSKFKELCERLLEKKGVTIILIGTKEDTKLNKYIKSENLRIFNTSGQFTLPELFYLMTKINVFISNDTGPMHIAAAQGVKTIGLFGPNTPKIWAPYGVNNISIFHPKKGCPYLDNTCHELAPKKLTEEQNSCMDAISVDEVYKNALRML